MNKFLKYGLLGVGGAVVLAALGIAYIAVTFNPNDYKAQVIRLVKEKKQRTLKLDGDIKLAFFPSIGVDIGKASLSEFGNEKEFSSIDRAHVSLALLPLFSKRVVVNEVVVSGLKVTLVKLKNGKTNIDDLMSVEQSKPESKAERKAESAQVRFNIASVRIEKTGLDYRDENSGAHYVLKDINLRTGRIADGVPVKTDFTAVLQANQPKLDATTQFVATLTFDLGRKSYRAEELALQAKGAISGIGDLVASLSLPEIKGDAQSFKSSALMLQLDMKQPAQAFKIRLSSPVSGNFETRQFNLPSLILAVSATGDSLPNKSVSSEIKGSVQLDAERQSVQANLAGSLLQSQVKAKVAVNGFDNPAIRFDIEADQFDVDAYLPKKREGAAKASASVVEQPMDFSALKKLNLEGSLRLDALKASNVKLSQLHLGVKAHNGLLNFNPLSANLYQGSMNGSATVNAAPATPTFTIKENLGGINIAPLIKDVMDFDALEGKGSVSLGLSAQGNTVSGLKKALSGNATLNLENGAIKGIDLTKLIRSAQTLGKGGLQTLGVSKGEKTEFSEFKASFKVSNGVAHNEDLMVKSAVLRLTGNGDINIGNDSLNYAAKATLLKAPEGEGGSITVPVRLSGPFADLKYTVDFGAMLAGIAKQKVEKKVEATKEEAKEKLKEQLKKNLKGLFK